MSEREWVGAGMAPAGTVRRLARHHGPVWLWRMAFVALVAGILYLALQPHVDRPDWFENADKLRHAVAFLVLYAIGVPARWFGADRWVAASRLVLSLLAFGVLIEVAQACTPDRDPSLADVAADAFGLVLAWGLHMRLCTDRVKPPAT